MEFVLNNLSRPRMFGAAAVAMGLMAVALPGQQARAQNATATSTMQITATVLKLCAVTATNLAFGDYTPTEAKDGQAELQVLCTTNTPFNVALNLGTATTAAARVMAGTVAGSTLNYALYRNSGRTDVWGDAAGTDTFSGTGTGTTQTIPVYGRIPANQRPQPGLYTDTVTVTLTY
ncbi:spore coat U domain-containing protein [Pseudoroseomonas globiformis]|uniref:Spore coat U domain-containing protein n=1 Tax=Teichococcus globiformis TaxID=2307229 RepID=A0ABV7FXB4_9PROT